MNFTKLSDIFLNLTIENLDSVLATNKSFLDHENLLQNITEFSSNQTDSNITTIEADQVYAISNAVSIVFIIIVVLVIFFWRRYQRNKKKLKKLTKQEVSKFLEGDCVTGDSGIDPDLNLPFSIPYDRNFEINFDDIEIDRTTLLGSGAYGMVFKGKLKATGIPVAIKTLKPNADMMYFKSLLSELKVITFIGEHDNIVKCIGACTAELTSRKLYIIVEFCALGSMEFYLRGHREDFKNCGKARDNDYQNLKLEPVVVEMEEITRTSYSKYVNFSRNGEPSDKLTVVDLIRFGYEIANAMDYLSTKKVVHGDLATRNVLLNEYRKVKLTDFGLSRQMLNYSTYVKTASKQNPLPWRWLSLETMKNNEFSTKSDVWSFGITLWEIFSLAQVPYPGLAYSQDFLRMLEKGLRMNPPSDFTPPEIYKIMIDSWHEIPQERSTFAELKEKLLEMCLNINCSEV